MQDKFIPKVHLQGEIADTKLYSYNDPMRMKPMDDMNEIPTFTEVMTGMVKELDATAKAPDQVLQDVMLGNGADIHDAMIAVSKAEIGINIATQITTKVIQAYEKVMAIQV